MRETANQTKQQQQQQQQGSLPLGTRFQVQHIGVGAQSTLGRDIFVRKYMYEKLT